MAQQRETYEVRVGEVVRHLRLFEVAPGVRIAILNILGDTELVAEAAKALAPRIPANADVLITPEVKSIPLAHQLAVETGLPYVVARKERKLYMGEAISEEVVSITTGRPQTLWLDEKDLPLLLGKNVVIVDDVVSTGGTMAGLRRLIAKASGSVVAEAAVFTEGNEPDKWKHVIALGNLPVFFDAEV
jgi:adenine/guanine phosphoribosyltransferase-like PRPP-binding protein